MATILEIEAQIREFTKLKYDAAEKEEFAKASEFKKKIIELEEKLKKIVEDELKSKKQRVEKIEGEVQLLKTQKYEAADREDFVLAGKLKTQIIELEKELSGHLQFIQTYEKPARKETVNIPAQPSTQVVESTPPSTRTTQSQTRAISPTPERAVAPPTKEEPPTNVRTQSNIKLVPKTNQTTPNSNPTKTSQAPTPTSSTQPSNISKTPSSSQVAPATKQTQAEPVKTSSNPTPVKQTQPEMTKQATVASKQANTAPVKQPEVAPVAKQASPSTKQATSSPPTTSQPQKTTQPAPSTAKTVPQQSITITEKPVQGNGTPSKSATNQVSAKTAITPNSPSEQRPGHKLTLVVSPTTISITPDGAKPKHRKTEVGGSESTKDRLLSELEVQKKNYQEVHRSTENLISMFAKAMDAVEQLKKDVSRLQQEQSLVMAAVSNA